MGIKPFGKVKKVTSMVRTLMQQILGKKLD